MKDILIVGEAWGAEEERQKKPFVGKTGDLLRRLLSECEFDLNRCELTNLVNARPRNNDMSAFFHPTGTGQEVDGLWPNETLNEGRKELIKLMVEMRPEITITLGNYPLWALTKDVVGMRTVAKKKVPTGINDWRGSMLRDRVLGQPLLPTFHPAATFRTYPWRAQLRVDLSRAAMYLRGEIPDWEPRSLLLTTQPSMFEVHRFFDRTLERLETGPVKLSCDIETRGGKISCIGFGRSSSMAICIPFQTTRAGRKNQYWDAPELTGILKKLKMLLEHPNIQIVGQNFAFDVQYLYNEFGILPKVHSDTMLKHHVLFPSGGDPTQTMGPQGIVQKNLNNLSSLYCQHHVYWKDEGKHWKPGMDEEQHWTYNCKDCVITYEVDEAMDEVMHKEQLESQYDFQMAQLNTLAIPMMLRGVKIDLDRRETMIAELKQSIAKTEEELLALVPEEFFADNKNKTPWYRSNAKLCNLFYDQLGIKPCWSPAGTRTTAKGALPTLAKREPLVKPITDKLGTLRSLNIFANTFLSAKLSDDGRMRCSFNVAGTETFRWSSSKNPYGTGGNIQNIPRETDKDSVFPDIRKLFIPDEGYMIIDADLSGADAAVVAWETGSPELMEAVRTGIKLHKVVAEELYGTAEHPHYDMTKRRIHATNYGGEAKNLHTILAGQYGSKYSTLKIEQDFQAYWFDRIPELKAWHQRIEKSLLETRGVRNAFGFRVVFQDRPNELFNQGLAWIPQSTVALVTLTGGLILARMFSFAQMLLQNHDSLVFQIPLDKQDQLPDIKQALNAITVPYPEPLAIPWDLKTSTESWGHCE